MSVPLVSTIIPVFNGERHLDAALRSVLAQGVHQQVIVVDDGSTDASTALAQRYPEVTCVRIEHGGQAAALNAGLSLARGELLAFLDCDDEWLSSKLHGQVSILRAQPKVDAVFGLAEQRWAADPARTVKPQPAHLPSAMLIRRRAFRRVGLFNEELALGMVIEWYGRLLDAELNEHMLPHLVYRRWIHGENLSSPLSTDRRDYSRALKVLLDRRRSERGSHL